MEKKKETGKKGEQKKKKGRIIALPEFCDVT